MSPSLLLIGLCLLIGRFILGPYRGRPGDGPLRRFVAPNVFELDHLCRAIGRLQRSGTELRVVVIDLERIDVVDATSLTSLDYASKQCERAGLRLVLEGCNPLVVAAIRARSLDIELRGAAPTSVAPTLH